MRIVLALLALATLVACNGDDDNEATDSAVSCEELFAPGADTDTAINVGDNEGCIADDGELTFHGNAFEECADGRTLYWNDEGWGFSGGPWHHHEGTETVAPDDERASCSG